MKSIYSVCILLLSLLALSAFSPAQSTARAADPVPVSSDKGNGNEKLPPNQEIKDSKGRRVKNRGENRNGRVHVRYTGTIDKSGDVWVCSGEITEVTNPASQGSEGPIDVATNDEPTTVNLDKNGTDPGGHVVTHVAGNNATVNVDGNFNDFDITGNNSTTSITGNNNTGTVNGTGGNVNLGGRGNSVTSGGTTVRN